MKLREIQMKMMTMHQKPLDLLQVKIQFCSSSGTISKLFLSSHRGVVKEEYLVIIIG